MTCAGRGRSLSPTASISSTSSPPNMLHDDYSPITKFKSNLSAPLDNYAFCTSIYWGSRHMTCISPDHQRSVSSLERQTNLLLGARWCVSKFRIWLQLCFISITHVPLSKDHLNAFGLLENDNLRTSPWKELHARSRRLSIQPRSSGISTGLLWTDKKLSLRPATCQLHSQANGGLLTRLRLFN